MGHWISSKTLAKRQSSAVFGAQLAAAVGRQVVALHLARADLAELDLVDLVAAQP